MPTFFTETLTAPRIRPVTEEKEDSKNDPKLCSDGPNSVVQHEANVARKVSLAFVKPEEDRENVHCDLQISAVVFHRGQE